jgi:hypothetical protein
MPQYMLAFHGGNPPSDPEPMNAFMARWKRWAGTLEHAITNDGSVFGRSVLLTDGDAGTADAGPDRLTGYYLMQADNLEVASAMVRGCPIFEVGGRIEVAELVPAAMTTGSGEHACA